MLRSLPIARTTTSPECSPIRDADLDAEGAARLGGVDLHRPLDRQRRVAGAHGMVLMRDRRAEQRHDAVAHDLVDRALVAMHGIHHDADRAVEDAARFFRVGAFDDRERALDVGEQHRDVLALARQSRPGIEDALGEVAAACRRRAARAERRLPLWRRRVEPGDRSEQLLAVTQGRDAELLEVVRRERAAGSRRRCRSTRTLRHIGRDRGPPAKRGRPPVPSVRLVTRSIADATANFAGLCPKDRLASTLLWQC